jgi:hypothetical protein
MTKGTDTEEPKVDISPEDSAEFPRIGGVFLGPVPEIEQEFYEKLLEDLYAAEAFAR